MSAGARVGLVGSGAVARLHVEAARALGADVVAVASPDVAGRGRFAEEFQVPVQLDGLGDLSGRSDLDLVIVATPSASHADLAVSAIEAGLNVLVEIPLGMSVAEVETVAAAAAARPEVVVGVGHTLRFWDPHVRLQQYLVEDPALHLSLRAEQLRVTNEDWQGTPRDWVDHVLWHHATHLVDAALWMSGTPEVRVQSAVDPRRGRPMFGTATLETGSAVIDLSVSYLSRRPRSEVVAVTERHTFQIDGARLYRDQELLLDADPAEVQRRAVVDQLADLLGAVGSEGTPRVGIPDAARAATIVAAIEASGQTSENDEGENQR